LRNRTFDLRPVVEIKNEAVRDDGSVGFARRFSGMIRRLLALRGYANLNFCAVVRGR
jgi:hypothetical protein